MNSFFIEEFTTLDNESCIQTVAGLSDQIFKVTNGKTRIRKRLERKNSWLILIAYTQDDHVPVGFKIGYEDTETLYYSWLGGVLPEYRGHGIASALMQRQHARIAEMGYHKVETRTRNRYKSMLILNIKHGFNIIGTQFSKNDVKIVLQKTILPQKSTTDNKEQD